jgi:microcompartment protein CcmL/EutN
MPARSKVSLLPAEVKAELDSRLIKSGFSGYEALEEWLGEQGCTISKSAIHRYGSKFEEKLGAIAMATEQAKAIASASEDDGNAMSDAVIRLIQEKVFQMLVEMENLDPENVSLPSLGMMIAKLTSSSVQVKEQQRKYREKAEQAAKEIENLLGQSKTRGLSEDMAAQIRSKVLGIAG